MPTYGVISKFGEKRYSRELADVRKHQPFEIVDRHECTCRGFGEFPGSHHQGNCPAMFVTVRLRNGQMRDVYHYAISVVEDTPVFAGSHITDERRGTRRMSIVLLAVAVAFLLRFFSKGVGPSVAAVLLTLAIMVIGVALIVFLRKGIRVSVGSSPRR